MGSIDFTGLGGVAGLVKRVVDIFVPPKAPPEVRLRAETKIREMMEDYENSVVNAKAAIITAELNQDDKITKRARPSILYGGLLVIMVNHVLFPILAWWIDVFVDRPLPELPDLTMPPQFWLAWGGVCSIYVIGRSREKAGGDTGGLMGRIMDMIAPQKGGRS